MKKFTLLFLLLLFVNSSYSQDILLEQDIYLRSYLSDKRDVYPVVDDFSGKITLFLIDSDTINALTYNKTYKPLNTFKCQRPSGKFKILIGHTVDQNNYNLFFTNKRNKEFLVKSIDLINNTSKEYRIPFKLNTEEYLQSICYKNKLYILSRTNYSSIYKLRVFEDNKLGICIEHDFTEILSPNSEPYRIADDLYDSPDRSATMTSFKKIEYNNPNSLDITSEQYKVYCYDDQIVLSFDNEKDKTKLITINLNNYTYKIKNYNQDPLDHSNRTNALSNSYIHMDKLYQLIVNKKELCLTINSLKTDSLLKTYRVKGEDEISFKNSALIQEIDGKGFTDSERELGKTKQVLRKLLAGSLGISVYETGNKLEVLLGGIKASPSTGNMIAMGLVGAVAIPLASGGAYYAVPNYTMNSYSSYTNSRSVYFKCLFDKQNLEHIVGDPSQNPFDKIKEFLDTIKTPQTTQTIFKINNHFVLGYYLSDEKKYYLRKFE
ncbi:hypothetical protein BZG02_18885 [Labilibaculum filiforme]|uniref:Uncharacterized protein n=1 Tax=Labilibaculum filiforme TaxID=1940526 RepID=A0A2N3HR44_9BACT|nr:hypothetical protein [Labilibaculum filiforme]PKQ60531.1 hypothetical protein BZG02_18885 [Labilibaculum filiforme]